MSEPIDTTRNATAAYLDVLENSGGFCASETTYTKLTAAFQTMMQANSAAKSSAKKPGITSADRAAQSTMHGTHYGSPLLHAVIQSIVKDPTAVVPSYAVACQIEK